MLLLLLLVVPFVEIYLLVVAGRWLGPWPVVGFLFASLVIGGSLARREGRRIARGMAEARRAGEAPSEGMVGALLAAVAGALLAWPGPLTTAAGLALLVPPVRRLLGRAAGRWVERRMSAMTIAFPGAGWPPGGGAGRPGGPGPHGDIIDIEPGEERSAGADGGAQEAGGGARGGAGQLIELGEPPGGGERRSP
ncbi:MAG TPA: FxsA family protein [Kofleriaceae bacterium]|nr:FxsA family protein [Kofleriaceae bacterium]